MHVTQLFYAADRERGAVMLETCTGLGRRTHSTTLALACGFAVFVVMPAAAQSPLPPIGQWQVQSNFKGQEARENLSGAACARTSPALRSCLIVNDQKKYAQFFSVEGTTIMPDPEGVIRLSDDEGDPDAEGAAYADGYFYVTGSHGRS